MAYILAILFLHIAFLGAKDLGNYGTTFSIDEENLIMVLSERLSKAQLDEQKQYEIRKAFTNSLKNPRGRSLPKATKLRCTNFDPTICVKEDLKDNEGNIIIAKGAKINPLETTELREHLLFFDGNDVHQLAWAKSQQGKWILTSGCPLDLEKSEGRAVYFDQNGYLTRTLNIRSLPAKVEQEGAKLKIEEIPCL